MKKKFTEWHGLEAWNDNINILPCLEVTKQFESGKNEEEIEVKPLLSKLKPLHVSWLKELYNHFTSTPGAQVIANGWKETGIKDAIKNGSSSL